MNGVSHRHSLYFMQINIALVTTRTSHNLARTVATLRFRLNRLQSFSAAWTWKAHVFELALIFGAYLLYLVTRGLVFSDQSEKGLVNAGHVIAAERWVGFLWEPGWQSWVLEHIDGLALFFNWVYIITYWPVIALVGLALYISNRPKYYYYRSVVVINLVLALLIFMFFPVTSPFNITHYFVNTIQTLGPSFYGSADMASYYNTNAAMPSLHFSWTIILSVAFARMLKGWFKPLALLYPAATFFAITITGNHFILDAIAGGLLAGLAFAVMELGFRRRLPHTQRNWEALKDLLRNGGAQAHKHWSSNAARLSAVARRSVSPRRKTVIR